MTITAASFVKMLVVQVQHTKPGLATHLLIQFQDIILEKMNFSELFRRTKDITAEHLFNEGICYHKKCYAQLTNKVLIERAKTRYEKGKQNLEVSLVRTKTKGRPMNITKTTGDNNSRLSRQSSFDKYLCIFCQETSKESLHEVTTANMGEQLLQIGKECKQETLRKRLSLLVADGNPLSAIAYDMKYHLSCLMTAKRQSTKISVESSKPLESTALLSPLIRSPPTDINTLYTAIMRTKYVTRQVCGPNQMTVVTFDLQLYDIAMKLWMTDETIRKQFIFRPEELHVVF